jgi:UDP-N-acetylmuramyl pentapeptide phosphotransferase/UDP-N-acetylglucosamine-1-phosphate transferase
MPLDLAGWLILHASLAVIGTWVVRGYALRRNMLDAPGERRSHTVATPRGGGLSIVVAVLLAFFWLASQALSDRPLLLAGASGLILVAGVGWIDDHRPLPAGLRLAVHLAAAGVLAAGFWVSGQGAWIAFAALLVVPVLVNVWNFMDGIDGLAVTQAAIAAGAYALISQQDPVVAALAWSLAAACLGFLPFNFPKARIFLGDVGSGALGYVLALLVVWTASRMQPEIHASAWPILLLPVSTFLVDASLTLAKRIVRRESWWMPHAQHAYQQTAVMIGTHLPVTFGYAIWTVMGSSLLVLLIDQAWAIQHASVFGWLVAASLVWLMMQNTYNARRPGQGTPK